MKAKAEEENRGQGAADARRWNGLRTIVEARALLKTAFRCASTLKAQVGMSIAGSWLLVVALKALEPASTQLGMKNLLYAALRGLDRVDSS